MQYICNYIKRKCICLTSSARTVQTYLKLMLRPSGCTVPSWKISLISSCLRRMLEPRHKCIPRTWTSAILWPAELKLCCATENPGVLLRTLRKCSPIPLLRLHTEEGLYPRNICVNRQFWHFSIIIPWIINLIFYFQVSRITNDISVYLFHLDLSTLVRACDWNWSLRFQWGSEFEINSNWK